MVNGNEIWKSVAGYEGKYSVSSLGRIKSFMIVEEGRILKPFKRNEYLFIILCDGKTKKSAAIHRLVAKAFLDSIQGKEQVNHKNCIRHDNRLENLEWCTPSENNAHAYANNRRTAPSKDLYGFDHWSTKGLLCLLTGKLFTIKEAAGFLDIKENSLYCMLNGKNKNWTNFIYYDNSKRKNKLG